ncbi:MAG: outer membrane beta-barrel protein [Rickettsiales bacterium]|nr:outer membrane beta-barrel protein [Rickettsiales bacterium]MDG4548709.1 outer membrane beta-barrel protein [Rickettsiales bacterium]
MSKKTLLLAATCSGLLLSSPAISAENTVRPYFGLEYQRIQADIKTIDGFDYGSIYADGYNAIAPYAGLRIGDYLGLEAGFTRSITADKQFNGTVSGVSVQSNIETQVTGYSLDAMGYMPIDKDKHLELIGEAGVGFYTVDTSGTGVIAGSIPVTLIGSEDSVALRLGAGVQLNVTDNWSIRTMVRYIGLDLQTVDSATAFSIGSSYTF